MMLNKKVVESAAVLGLATVLSITAVTNSDKAVIANTSVEYDGIAGVTAALADISRQQQMNTMLQYLYRRMMWFR